ERGQAGRVAHRRLRGDPAAERTPDEMDTGEFELVEEVEIEIRQIPDGIQPWRRIGSTEAGMLGSDNVELSRQPRHAREPDSHAAAAMKKEQRRRGAAGSDGTAALADRNGRN